MAGTGAGMPADAHDGERCRALLLRLLRDVAAFARDQQLRRHSDLHDRQATLWIHAVARVCEARVDCLQRTGTLRDVSEATAAASPTDIVAEAMVQELLISLLKIRLAETEAMVLDEVENVESLRLLRVELQHDETVLRRAVRDGAGEDSQLLELQRLLREAFVEQLAQSRAQGVADALHNESSLQFAWETIQEQKQEIQRLRAENEQLKSLETPSLSTPGGTDNDSARQSIQQLQLQLSSHPYARLPLMEAQLSLLEAAMGQRDTLDQSRHTITTSGATFSLTRYDLDLDRSLQDSVLLPSHLDLSNADGQTHECAQCRRYGRAYIECHSDNKRLRAQAAADEDALARAERAYANIKNEHAALTSALLVAKQKQEELRQMIVDVTDEKLKIQALQETQQRANEQQTASLQHRLAELEQSQERSARERLDALICQEALENELKRLQASVGALERERDAHRQDSQQLKLEIADLTAQTAIAKTNANAILESFTTAERELKSTQQQLEAAQQQISTHVSTIENLKRAQKNRVDSEAIASRQLEQLQTERDLLADTTRQLREEIATTTAEAKVKIDSLTRKVDDEARHAQEVTASHAALQAECDVLLDSIKRLQQEVADQKEEMLSTKADAAEARQALAMSETKVASLNQALDTSQQFITQHQVTIAGLEEEARKRAGADSATLEHVRQLELERNALLEDAQQLKQEVANLKNQVAVAKENAETALRNLVTVERELHERKQALHEAQDQIATQELMIERLESAQKGLAESEAMASRRIEVLQSERDLLDENIQRIYQVVMEAKAEVDETTHALTRSTGNEAQQSKGSYVELEAECAELLDSIKRLKQRRSDRMEGVLSDMIDEGEAQAALPTPTSQDALAEQISRPTEQELTHQKETCVRVEAAVKEDEQLASECNAVLDRLRDILKNRVISMVPPTEETREPLRSDEHKLVRVKQRFDAHQHDPVSQRYNTIGDESSSKGESVGLQVSIESRAVGVQTSQIAYDAREISVQPPLFVAATQSKQTQTTSSGVSFPPVSHVSSDPADQGQSSSIQVDGEDDRFVRQREEESGAGDHVTASVRDDALHLEAFEHRDTILSTTSKTTWAERIPAMWEVLAEKLVRQSARSRILCVFASHQRIKARQTRIWNRFALLVAKLTTTNEVRALQAMLTVTNSELRWSKQPQETAKQKQEDLRKLIVELTTENVKLQSLHDSQQRANHIQVDELHQQLVEKEQTYQTSAREREDALARLESEITSINTSHDELSKERDLLMERMSRLRQELVEAKQETKLEKETTKSIMKTLATTEREFAAVRGALEAEIARHISTISDLECERNQLLESEAAASKAARRIQEQLDRQATKTSGEAQDVQNRDSSCTIGVQTTYTHSDTREIGVQSVQCPQLTEDVSTPVPEPSLEILPSDDCDPVIGSKTHRVGTDADCGCTRNGHVNNGDYGQQIAQREHHEANETGERPLEADLSHVDEHNGDDDHAVHEATTHGLYQTFDTPQWREAHSPLRSIVSSNKPKPQILGSSKSHSKPCSSEHECQNADIGEFHSKSGVLDDEEEDRDLRCLHDATGPLKPSKSGTRRSLGDQREASHDQSTRADLAACEQELLNERVDESTEFQRTAHDHVATAKAQPEEAVADELAMHSVQRLQRRLAELEQSQEQAGRERLDALISQEALENELRRLQASVDALERERDACLEAGQRLKLEVVDLKTQTVTEKASVDATLKSLTTAERELISTQQQLKAAQQQITTHESTIESLKRAQKDLVESKAIASHQFEAFQNERDILVENARRLGEELAATKAETEDKIETLTKNADDKARQAQEVKASHAMLQAECDVLLDSIKRLHQEVADQKEELLSAKTNAAEARQALETSRNEVTSLNLTAATTQQLIRQLEATIVRLEGDVRERAECESVAVEKARQLERERDALVEDAQQLKLEIVDLKSQVAKAKAEAEAAVQIVATPEREMHEPKQQVANRNAETVSDMINAGEAREGPLTGTSELAFAQQTLRQAHEVIAQHEATITRLEGALRQSTAAEAVAVEQARRVASERDALLDNAHQLNLVVVELNSQAAVAKADAEAALGKFAMAERELQSTQQHLHAAQQEISTHEATIESLKRLQNDLVVSEATTSRRVEQLQSERDALLHNVQQLQREIAETQAKTEEKIDTLTRQANRDAWEVQQGKASHTVVQTECDAVLDTTEPLQREGTGRNEMPILEVANAGETRDALSTTTNELPLVEPTVEAMRQERTQLEATIPHERAHSKVVVVLSPSKASRTHRRHRAEARPSEQLHSVVHECVTLLRQCIRDQSTRVVDRRQTTITTDKTWIQQHSASEDWTQLVDLNRLVWVLLEASKQTEELKIAMDKKLEEIHAREHQLQRLERHCAELRQIVEAYQAQRVPHRQTPQAPCVDATDNSAWWLSPDHPVRGAGQSTVVDPRVCALEKERRRLNQRNVAMLERVIEQLQDAKRARQRLHDRLQRSTLALDTAQRYCRAACIENLLLRAFFTWRVRTLR